MRAERAASSIGTKQALWLNKPRQRLLRALEFIERGLPFELAQRNTVGECVIADEVAFFTCARRDSGARRLTHFPADDEESRFQIVTGETIEYEGSYVWFGPVVES